MSRHRPGSPLRGPRSVLLLALILAATVARAERAGTVTSDDLSALSLEDLLAVEVVSATRTGETLDELPSSVTVIRREEILLSGARSIPEVLRTTAGLEVVASTAASYDVGARGATELMANTLLVLVDGRPVNEELGGQVVWSFLPVGIDQVHSIEIVRGPASAMYGANAFTGVLNIVTVSPRDDGEREARVVLGSLGQEAGFQTSQRSPDTAWRLHADVARIRDRVPTSDVPRPGSETLRGHFAWQKTLTGERRIHFDSGMTYGRSETLPVSVMQSLDFEGRSAFAQVRVEGPRWDAQASVRGSRFDIYPMEIDFVDPIENLQTRTAFATAQRTLRLPLGNTLVVGTDLRSLSMRSDLQVDRDDFSWALFVQDKWELGSRWIANVGLRYDDHPFVDEELSARASLVVRVIEGHTLSAVVGNAFLTPSLIENSVRFSGEIVAGVPITFQGDATVAPERIRSAEIGWRARWGGEFETTVTAYAQRVDDVIEFAVAEFHGSPPAPFPGIPARTEFVNGGTYEVTGLETSFHFRRGSRLHVRGSYGFTDATDDGRRVAHVPRHRVGLGVVVRPTDLWRSSLRVHASTESDWASIDAFSLGESIGIAGDYVDVDLEVVRSLSTLDLAVGVRNLLDQEVHDHPLSWSQERAVYVGLSTQR